MKTYQPLKGIKVASFELAFALPAGTRALHDLGADVIRIASPRLPAERYIAQIDGVFHGKRCISLDLTTERGRELAFDLAMKADVVCNNFRPQVLPKYGLSAERLRAARPELIVLQLSGYGTPGPWSTFPAFGPSTEAAGGMNRMLVEEGDVPVRIGVGVFSDQLAGRHAALAIAAALRKRQETGRGATIDLSMTAAISHLLGPRMTRAALDDTAMPPFEGNRDPRFVPQGIYPALGNPGERGYENDEWIAISVTDDAAWQKLAVRVGRPDLAPLDRAAREARHDEIDAVLANWSQRQAKDLAAAQLQDDGVSAAAVRTVKDTPRDPQLQARGALQLVRHDAPVMGHRAHPHPPLPWRTVGHRRRTLTDFRDWAQDNEAILADWLGLDAPTVRQLTRDGVLGRRQPLTLADRPAAPNRESDFADFLGLPT